MQLFSLIDRGGSGSVRTGKGTRHSILLCVPCAYVHSLETSVPVPHTPPPPMQVTREEFVAALSNTKDKVFLEWMEKLLMRIHGGLSISPGSTSLWSSPPHMQ